MPCSHGRTPVIRSRPRPARRARPSMALQRTERYQLADVRAIYEQPFPDLAFAAIQAHRAAFDPLEVQCSTLLSIKTGGCPEDCTYCPQSARYHTPVRAEPLMPLPQVLDAARAAKAGGATRFCMGAAWRGVKDGPEFDRVLEMVREVSSLGMETCVTLGLLQEHQARRLRDAGLDYYNHNLDTSESYYAQVVSTRTFEQRRETLGHVRDAGIHVCCGGIVGMGESKDDRIAFLWELANFETPPESVPINVLVPVEGTPLADRQTIDPLEFVRTVATARILMPHSMVRLSAGRREMSTELQALCFLVGANSIFAGDKLLTTPNPGDAQDEELLRALGMRPMASPLR
ncbi:MAG: biotin synthase BioB [Bacillati bacterium]